MSNKIIVATTREFKAKLYWMSATVLSNEDPEDALFHLRNTSDKCQRPLEKQTAWDEPNEHCQKWLPFYKFEKTFKYKTSRPDVYE